MRIIPAKFGQNPASSLGGDDLKAIVDDGRHTTHGGGQTTDIQHSQKLSMSQRLR